MRIDGRLRNNEGQNGPPHPRNAQSPNGTQYAAQARIFFSHRIDGLHDTLDLIRDGSAAMAAHKFQIGQAVSSGLHLAVMCRVGFM